MIVDYKAVDRGHLVSGHRAGQSYKLEIELEQYDAAWPKDLSENRSIGGRAQTLLRRIDEQFSCRTVPIMQETTSDKMLEFLSSVAGGESFVFDAFGDMRGSDNPFRVMLVGDYSRTRVNRFEKYRYSFTVRKINEG